ncbi:hypothetical protein C1645_738578 [Glomus cerebriforme]|uniref:Yeast cell wall synthesis Kre9/Knh1-like N-terminal domain-containing protein n=1 Tax=Glomus cerebriforme TaxID=658196 RepID=A0A397T375_9GLOM|nr:hypothetical protein C1645_738578 [Glomus cerebriforme]
MKSSYSFVALVAFLLNVGTINANIYPTNPDGSAIFSPNQQVTIQWNDDGKAPSLKTIGKVQVDFMTGADLSQVALGPIGTVDATLGKLAWIVPEVDPAGKFYFLRFSNGKSGEVYSTRFTITDINGKYPPEVNPPPPVGKNLGKIGKIVAKGVPNGKQTGVGNPNTAVVPNQPTTAQPTTAQPPVQPATASKTPKATVPKGNPNTAVVPNQPNTAQPTTAQPPTQPATAPKTSKAPVPKGNPNEAVAPKQPTTAQPAPAQPATAPNTSKAPVPKGNPNEAVAPKQPAPAQPAPTQPATAPNTSPVPKGDAKTAKTANNVAIANPTTKTNSSPSTSTATGAASGSDTSSAFSINNNNSKIVGGLTFISLLFSMIF